jgi:hypothetical protein
MTWSQHRRHCGGVREAATTGMQATKEDGHWLVAPIAWSIRLLDRLYVLSKSIQYFLLAANGGFCWCLPYTYAWMKHYEPKHDPPSRSERRHRHC